MDFSCSFCNKVEEEVPLIEISANLLLINKSYYDFTKIFYDLFSLTPGDLHSNFICDLCKDSIVQFFIFKKSISCQMNQHMKMILSQVEDFLSETCIEDIQVIRKLNSITLLVGDENIIKDSSIILEETMTDNQDLLADSMDDEVPNDWADEFSEKFTDDEIVEEIGDQEQKAIDLMFPETNYFPCVKCGELLRNEDSEVHDFFKHSLIGIHIENDIINTEMLIERENSPKTMKKCTLCNFGFKDSSSSYRLHVIETHIAELLMKINETYNILPSPIDIINIHKFINHVNDLMQAKYSEIDEITRKRFFELYSGDSLKTGIDPLIESDGNIVYNQPSGELKTSSAFDMKRKKIGKATMNLTEKNRAWIRKEIGLRKKATSNELGKKRFIYQCVYCKKFSSNSAPGFRYHLVKRHLSENDPEDLQEVETQFHLPPNPCKTEKNTCFECNLKFKDQKLLRSHVNCHDLFAVIAQDYVFPSCNTCSKFFIDESTLERHLELHNTDEDVGQPIKVDRGALVIQGKLLTDASNYEMDEISDIEFSWKCGHCWKRFYKEELCRFHLLMFHAPHFVCPIEKREFHGFKAVSLFAHHLKNKHSHLFPEITFPCTFCKLEFPSVYDKLSHMKSCNLKKFSCDHCGKKFFKKGDLMTHMKFVSGELFYPCRVCYKRCETMSDLKIHLRSHTKEKPFECSICSKSFRTLAGRSAHVETHNTSTLYACFCGKTFKQRQMYRRHVKAIHEANEKTESVYVTEMFEESSQ